MKSNLALAIAASMGRMVMPSQVSSRDRRGQTAHQRNPAREHAAQTKRDQRNGHRLNTWTGVRHDTPHVPSTVIKLEPREPGRNIYR